MFSVQTIKRVPACASTPLDAVAYASAWEAVEGVTQLHGPTLADPPKHMNGP